MGGAGPVLTVQIETDLFGRQGQAVTNFSTRLPPPQSDLCSNRSRTRTLRLPDASPEDAVERDLETGLVAHIQKFLLELGAGFAFVGQQVHLAVGDEDFYLDLLFYHLKLDLLRGHRSENEEQEVHPAHRSVQGMVHLPILCFRAPPGMSSKASRAAAAYTGSY